MRKIDTSRTLKGAPVNIQTLLLLQNQAELVENLVKVIGDDVIVSGFEKGNAGFVRTSGIVIYKGELLNTSAVPTGQVDKFKVETDDEKKTFEDKTSQVLYKNKYLKQDPTGDISGDTFKSITTLKTISGMKFGGQLVITPTDLDIDSQVNVKGAPKGIVPNNTSNILDDIKVTRKQIDSNNRYLEFNVGYKYQFDAFILLGSTPTRNDIKAAVQQNHNTTRVFAYYDNDDYLNLGYKYLINITQLY